MATQKYARSAVDGSAQEQTIKIEADLKHIRPQPVFSTIRAPSKQIPKPSKQNMHWAASLRKKRKDFPPPLHAHC